MRYDSLVSRFDVRVSRAMMEDGEELRARDYVQIQVEQARENAAGWSIDPTLLAEPEYPVTEPCEVRGLLSILQGQYPD